MVAAAAVAISSWGYAEPGRPEHKVGQLTASITVQASYTLKLRAIVVCGLLLQNHSL
jgi:hypothetical protein